MGPSETDKLAEKLLTELEAGARITREIRERLAAALAKQPDISTDTNADKPGTVSDQKALLQKKIGEWVTQGTGRPNGSPLQCYQDIDVQREGIAEDVLNIVLTYLDDRSKTLHDLVQVLAFISDSFIPDLQGGYNSIRYACNHKGKIGTMAKSIIHKLRTRLLSEPLPAENTWRDYESLVVATYGHLSGMYIGPWAQNPKMPIKDRWLFARKKLEELSVE